MWADLVRNGEVETVGPLDEDDVADAAHPERRVGPTRGWCERIREAHRRQRVVRQRSWSAGAAGIGRGRPTTLPDTVGPSSAPGWPSAPRVVPAGDLGGRHGRAAAGPSPRRRRAGGAGGRRARRGRRGKGPGLLDGSATPSASSSPTRSCATPSTRPSRPAHRGALAPGRRRAAGRGRSTPPAPPTTSGWAAPTSRAAAGEWFVRAGEREPRRAGVRGGGGPARAPPWSADPPTPGRVRLRLGAALLAVGDAAGARAAHLAALASGAGRAGTPELMARGRARARAPARPASRCRCSTVSR